MSIQIDFGKIAQDYRQYRVGFPDRFFERLFEFNIGVPGQTVLDLGTGTGTIARGLAQRGCQVTGLDLAPALLDQAKELDRLAKVTIQYVAGQAEATELPADSFDVITVGQSWHWFDRPKVLAEIRRLLVPEGRLVIAQFDWVPLPGSVVEPTEQLIEKYNHSWSLGGGTGLHPEWLHDLVVSGFDDVETFSFDVWVRYTHETWCGRIRASSGVGGSLPPHQLMTFNDELAYLLKRRFPEEPLTVLHRVFAVVSHI